MKKTATITFHAAHNYGSMLQAFALQQIIKNIGHDNVIINLRTLRQKNMYSYEPPFSSFNVKSIIKSLFYFPFRKSLQKRNELFEKFLQEDLTLTEEYSTLEQLQQANLEYDCFVSGGDQIWNTSPLDFDWSYYLPFVSSGKRISYAVSMGPLADKQVTNRERVANYLSKYDHISVREFGTQKLVQSLVNTPVSIDLDPAMLLTREQWFKRVDENPIVSGDYILLYSPGYKKSVYDVARKLGKKLKMKVVVTIYYHNIYLFPFERQFATGPWEFLNIVRHSKLVVSGSFHALVFATLFHVPFFAVNGDKDNRMRTFLKNMGLYNRTINLEDIDRKYLDAFSVDFTEADKFIDANRNKGIEYLKNAIEE